MKVLYKTLVGSRLYGLATEKSDTDHKGCFMPDLDRVLPTQEALLGFAKFKPQPRDEYNYGEGKDKVEGVLYSARYFLELFMGGNPTLTEIPFADDQFVIEKTDLGVKIMKFVRQHMITRHLCSSYQGYFFDQINDFKRGQGKHREKRHELVEEFGFDCKKYSHAYRIGVQGVELFNYGTLNPTMHGEKLSIARDMKVGKMTKEESSAIIDQVAIDLKDSIKNSPLPEDVDRELVSKFSLDIHKEYFNL